MARDDHDSFGLTPHDAVVTLWFVSAAHPEKVIEQGIKADRGFGRKYLAQLNPAWPITPIGQFALNRSAHASPGEFYIAGLPGVAVVQTVIPDATALSLIDQKLLTSIPAADVYAFAHNEETGMGGFAHWRGGKLRRSFCARRERVYEDVGLPEPFEADYWAGKKAAPMGGIALPFEPVDLMEEAQRRWLGFDMATSQDVNVVAYAIDGRPEPKLAPPPGAHPQRVDLSSQAASKLGLGAKRDYDDYEEPDEDEQGGAEFARLVEATSNATRRARRIVRSKVSATFSALKERIRHSDRPAKKHRPALEAPGSVGTQDNANNSAADEVRPGATGNADQSTAQSTAQQSSNNPTASGRSPADVSGTRGAEGSAPETPADDSASGGARFQRSDNLYDDLEEYED